MQFKGVIGKFIHLTHIIYMIAHSPEQINKGRSPLTIGYTNFSHVTIVFIAKYLFTGNVKILNKIVFKIAIKFISMRNPEISYCLYSEKFK